MKTVDQARGEHSARGNKRLRETGYNAMASTQRREATPPAKYARGGKVGKSGAKTQVNIIVPHHGGAPGGAPMPMPPHPAMPVAAPAGLGRPPMPPMGAPAPGGMPPGGPGPMKKGGRVKR